ncbi:MAG: alpha/beta hydrolase, partial [Ethanoligenens sp.]
MKEFGKEHSNIILMFHPNCVWWEIFNYVIPTLSEKYHLIIPAMPGHDPEHPQSVYTSVEQISEEVESWLLAQRYGRIQCLYGCSMGGAVATRVIADNRLQFEHIVIDAG